MLKQLAAPELSKIAATEARCSRLAVLAGAGISMVPPTRLPGGDELRDLAVRALATGSRLGHTWDLLPRRPGYARLLPELAFQRLWEYLDHKITGFFEVLRPAAPNSVHQLLAGLAATYNVPLATTNFDHLIEDSIAHPPPVTHLHGSLDRSDSMVVRLNQVGRPLPPHIAMEFQANLADRTLLVLGYSGRDTDVMRLILRSSARQVLWLVRDGADPALAAALTFSIPTQVATGDLAALPRQLRNDLPIPEEIPRTTLSPMTLPAQRELLLTNWKRSVAALEKRLGLSAIFVESGDFETATQLVLEGVGDLSSAPAYYLISGAGLLRLTAYFSEGLSFVNEALSARRECLPDRERARALMIAGLLLLEKHRPAPARALRRFREGKQILLNRIAADPSPLDSERDQQLLARLHNNIGLAHERLEQLDHAAAAYKESLRVKGRLGDTVGRAQSAANLSLAYYKKREFKKAAYWRREALDSVERYDLNFLHAYLLRRWGTIACEQGRVAFGRRTLEQALIVAREIRGDSFDLKLIERALRHYSGRS